MAGDEVENWGGSQLDRITQSRQEDFWIVGHIGSEEVEIKRGRSGFMVNGCWVRPIRVQSFG